MDFHLHLNHKRKLSSPKQSQNSLNFSMKNLTTCPPSSKSPPTIITTSSTIMKKNVGVVANLPPRHSLPNIHHHLGGIPSISINSVFNGGRSPNPSNHHRNSPSPNNTSTTGVTPINYSSSSSQSSSSSGGGVGHHSNVVEGSTLTPGLGIPLLPEILAKNTGPAAALLPSGSPNNSIKKKIASEYAAATANNANTANNPTTTPTPTTANKIVSQNVNGTLALTGIPRTDSELQLFRVLQRANLLSYFDVMIELGGDDVQQLCEAGEEEFLEIMALIGMASKPLHVRRLQKALQEWMTNPALFQTPVLPPGIPSSLISAATTGGGGRNPPTTANLSTPSPPTGGSQSLRTSPQPQQPLPLRPIPYPAGVGCGSAAAAMAQHAAMFYNNVIESSKGGGNHKLPLSNGHIHTSNGTTPSGGRSSLPHLSPNSIPSTVPNHSFSNGYHHHPLRSHTTTTTESSPHNKEPPTTTKEVRFAADQIIPSHFLEQRIRTNSQPGSPAGSDAAASDSNANSSHSPVPFLQDHELNKITDAAGQIVKTLPPYVFEPQPPSKRKFNSDYELVLRLPPSDLRRIEEIRRMATIYGRPDSNHSTYPNKRKNPKPLTMHEVCVNEAAFQLCKHVPALLTYRDELSALAKQVVRDADLPYTSNHAHYSYSLNNNNSAYTNQNNSGSSNKRHSMPELPYMHNGEHHHHHHLNGAKRLRVEGANGLEIQEFSRSPSSNHSEPGDLRGPQDNHQAMAMQITPIRNVPRRSPSEESSHSSHSPNPLEVVAVTTSSPSSPSRRSSGSRNSGSPQTILGSGDNCSEDNNNSNSSQRSSSNSTQTNKVTTSIGVTGGLINITHDPSIIGSSSSTMKLIAIKSEPAS